MVVPTPSLSLLLQGVYTRLVYIVLILNLTNKLALVDVMYSNKDAAGEFSDFMFYTTKLAHLLYECLGIMVFHFLRQMLKDRKDKTGKIIQLGGFKQLLRADADIFLTALPDEDDGLGDITDKQVTSLKCPTH